MRGMVAEAVLTAGSSFRAIVLMVVAGVLGLPLGSEVFDVVGGGGKASCVGDSTGVGCTNVAVVPLLDGHCGPGVGPKGAEAGVDVSDLTAGA